MASSPYAFQAENWGVSPWQAEWVDMLVAYCRGIGQKNFQEWYFVQILCEIGLRADLALKDTTDIPQRGSRQNPSISQQRFSGSSGRLEH